MSGHVVVEETVEMTPSELEAKGLTVLTWYRIHIQNYSNNRICTIAAFALLLALNLTPFFFDQSFAVTYGVGVLNIVCGYLVLEVLKSFVQKRKTLLEYEQRHSFHKSLRFYVLTEAPRLRLVNSKG